jgi:glycine cleavage system aminomethyltransferase T
VEFDNDNAFVSRAALEKIRTEGVRQKLVGVRIDGAPLGMWLEEFWPVTDGSERVGRLVSASYSPRLEFNMGFAWVPIGTAAEGMRIEIESPDGPITATVTALPFVDPKKKIPARS